MARPTPSLSHNGGPAGEDLHSQTNACRSNVRDDFRLAQGLAMDLQGHSAASTWGTQPTHPSQLLAAKWHGASLFSPQFPSPAFVFVSAACRLGRAGTLPPGHLCGAAPARLAGQLSPARPAMPPIPPRCQAAGPSRWTSSEPAFQL